MKCPKCKTENPETRKFCRECGEKLLLICPQCGSENLPSDKFCGECGHNLTVPSGPTPKDLSFDEKLDKIQRYLPKGLTEKILSQRNKIEGERKQVTVMFCDMEGFTSLVEKLGPEETYGIMDKVYEILIHKVHYYEGTVNEMTGDGIMAIFGAPIALEDAPQRAIRSALAIHREMARFSDKLEQEKEGITHLKIRIGVHTGPVVVGTLGNDLRVEFKAVGDTVNLASRMESLAEPGTTYVTEDTFKITEGFFRFEALGAREIKGKEQPVRVYRVIAPSTRRTRFDVSAERGLTPFVGRGRELELLLDAFERVKAGRGQAFSITAEAGVGKSRLLYEFRKAVSNEDVTFLEGKCLSYSKSVAYHPVIDILKANFDIRDGDGDSEIKKKAKRQLKILGVDEPSTLPYLLELLSVKDSGIDKIPMSPEGRKDRIMEALKRIVLKGSEIRPLIMAIEDLHWIDKSSEDSFKDLLDSITGAKIFLIFTYRPEFVHAWGGKSFHSQLNLNRLSNRESLAMLTYFLEAKKIDRVLEGLILDKTEGVPFFIEEFIRSIKDLKIIEKKGDKYHMAKDIQNVTIPSTIQDVIMARVDSLPDTTKRTLQICSVIEREFSYDLIKRVADFSESELLEHLSALNDSELLYQRGIFPQTTYIFKHALTREVVYDSILTKKKKNLHEKIGDVIEELYQKAIHEHYGLLAEHYIASENYEKATEYLRLAARKDEKAGSFTDAISYTERRVVCLERLPQTEDVKKKIIDARTTLGLYYIQTDFFVKAKEAIEPIVELTVKRNNKRRVAQIYSILGTYKLTVENDFPKAFIHFEKALKISEEVNDITSLVLASWVLGAAQAQNCEFKKAFQNIGKALSINTAANILWGISIMKSCQSYCCYNPQGRINLAYQTSEQAIGIAEESDDTYSKSIVYPQSGCSSYHKGFFKEAKEYLLKGADFCERINSNMWNSVAQRFLGDTYFELGEYQKSKDHYEIGFLLLESNRMQPSWIYLNKIGIAKAEVMMDEKGIDLESLYSYEAMNKVKIYESDMQRYIAEILLNIDNQHMNEAEDWIKKAIEIDKRNGMMWHLGRDYALYSELHKRKSDLPKAKEKLNKAIEILKECGADGWVEKYELELSKL